MKMLCYVLCVILVHLTTEVQSASQIQISNDLQPISKDNIFQDPVYYNWCSSIIKGEDGKYHMIYARWKKEYTFYAWLTHSTVAHAVADKPEGPYTYVNTIMDFEEDHYKKDTFITAHNPKIKYFNGRYYIYFISTRLDRDISNEELIATAKTGFSHANWKPLRTNLRTFVASSSFLDKGWKIESEPLLEPSGPITTIVVNPAVTQGHDNRFYLIVKGDKPGTTRFVRNQAIAISDYPDKGFVMQPKPVIQDWDTEDMSLWYDDAQKRYYAFFHAHRYIGMMTSKNGLDWTKADDFTILKKAIARTDGTTIRPERMERPFVFAENNQPKVLCVAVKRGREAYIVTIPIKRK